MQHGPASRRSLPDPRRGACSLGNYSDAASDLNLIRSRAGLPPTTATEATDLLPAIWRERQVELSTEWGQRWLDLKRSGQADAVLGAEKPGLWAPKAVLYPIPAGELDQESQSYAEYGILEPRRLHRSAMKRLGLGVGFLAINY
ncbi:RagB/SusD family nutrient uptake outer membrane protein [Puia sp. P3]|uniref:RagB/SusD family nutrient uptake outer membrane protein n=1 Tax=Puia sp. P3 TaxID=3423952 RepID=UPI003D67208F